MGLNKLQQKRNSTLMKQKRNSKLKFFDIFFKEAILTGSKRKILFKNNVY